MQIGCLILIFAEYCVKIAFSKMSVTSSGSALLPKLRQAKFKNLEFKSGATFEGGIEDHKKSGKGIFSWPNGARYEGHYSNNQRHGKG